MPEQVAPTPDYPAWAKSMTDAELAVSIEHYASELAAHGEAMKALRAELGNRYVGQMGDAMLKKGANHGKVTVDMDTFGFQVQGERKRTIEWDGEKLLGLALSMPAGEAKAKLKITVTCPDRTYKDATGELRAKLEAARTERVSEWSGITLIRIPDEPTETPKDTTT